MKLTFASRIFAGYFIVVAIAAWFLVNSFIDDFKPVVRQSVEHTLVDTAAILAELLSDSVARGKIEPELIAKMDRIKTRTLNASIWRLDKSHVALNFYITNKNGIVIYDSQGKYQGQDYSQWRDVYLTLRGKYGARSTALSPEDPFSSVMHVAAPVKSGGEIIGVVTAYTPNISLQPFIDRSRTQAINKGLVLLAIALIIGAIISWWLSRSIDHLIHYAKRVQAGERVQAPKLVSGELRQLANQLELMRRELEGKDYVKRYVEQLAHELKSPIAAIKGASEFLGDTTPTTVREKFRSNIEQESSRLEKTIEQMLDLTRLEKLDQLDNIEYIGLQQLLEEISRELQPKADVKQLSLNIVLCSSDISITADPRLLRTAIKNLIDNAIDFAPDNTQISIKAETDEQWLHVCVLDEGPGIPNYALGRIFERFYSLPRTHGGKSTGLGLPFVREVAKLHGGTIDICNAEHGTQAHLKLPRQHLIRR